MWPFTTSSKFDPKTQIPSLDGKVILVTGGNTGIGKETILQLARHRPQRLYLAARTESKAREAIASIEKELADSTTTDSAIKIEFLPLDLMSLPSIKDAAEKVKRDNDRLDILFLNAGIMATPPGKTEAGHEIQLGTNHVGHFLLTKLLLPTMQKTASTSGSDVRIVSVSSEGNNLAPAFDTIISTEKLSATTTWTRYGASKACNIIFAAELARRYPEITSTSLHPGVIKTNLYTPSEQNWVVKYGLAAVAPIFFASVPDGALNQLWTGVGAKKEELTNGAYYTPVGKVRSNNKWATNEDYGKRLWEWTETELNKAGY